MPVSEPGPWSPSLGLFLVQWGLCFILQDGDESGRTRERSHGQQPVTAHGGHLSLALLRTVLTREPCHPQACTPHRPGSPSWLLSPTEMLWGFSWRVSSWTGGCPESPPAEAEGIPNPPRSGEWYHYPLQMGSPGIPAEAWAGEASKETTDAYGQLQQPASQEGKGDSATVRRVHLCVLVVTHPGDNPGPSSHGRDSAT